MVLIRFSTRHLVTEFAHIVLLKHLGLSQKIPIPVLPNPVAFSLESARLSTTECLLDRTVPDRSMKARAGEYKLSAIVNSRSIVTRALVLRGIRHLTGNVLYKLKDCRSVLVTL